MRIARDSKTHLSAFRRGWPRRLAAIDRAPGSKMEVPLRLVCQEEVERDEGRALQDGGVGNGKKRHLLE